MSEDVKKSNTEEEKVFCRRCGRLLIDEQSKLIGFGRKCYSIYKKELLEQSRLFITGGTDNNEIK